MIGTAYAMGQSGAGAQPPGGAFAQFIPILIMFVIIYFLLIRPQQKKMKEHREMMNNIKKGDKVVTSGGIYGTVTAVSETTLNLEIADKLEIKLDKACVNTVLNAAGQKGKESK